MSQLFKRKKEDELKNKLLKKNEKKKDEKDKIKKSNLKYDTPAFVAFGFSRFFNGRPLVNLSHEVVENLAKKQTKMYKRSVSISIGHALKCVAEIVILLCYLCHTN